MAAVSFFATSTAWQNLFLSKAIFRPRSDANFGIITDGFTPVVA